MKPTTLQAEVLERIEDGLPVLESQLGRCVNVASFQWSRDGDSIVAHRTVLTGRTGNPRLDYRTELFRITREGGVTKL
jgi:hypothetical protein